jgi:hypothetical protein
MPAIAVSGIPSWGIADALTVDPSNDVSVYPEAKYCTLVRFWILHRCRHPGGRPAHAEVDQGGAVVHCV